MTVEEYNREGGLTGRISNKEKVRGRKDLRSLWLMSPKERNINLSMTHEVTRRESVGQGLACPRAVPCWSAGMIGEEFGNGLFN